jgi:hypothetical protein
MRLAEHFRLETRTNVGALEKGTSKNLLRDPDRALRRST